MKYRRMIAAAVFLALLSGLLPAAAYAASNPYAPSVQGADGSTKMSAAYVVWKETNQRLGITLPAWGRADTWLSCAQGVYQTGTEPRADSIAVCDGGEGSVAYVTAVSGSTVTLLEGGNDWTGTYESSVHTQTRQGSVGTYWDDDRRIVGYIYPAEAASEAPCASFYPWEHEGDTYIQETDAAIGQQICVTGAEWTQVGLILYDSGGKKLAQCGEVPTDQTRYSFALREALGMPLVPGTTYQYQFYVIVDGQSFYSARAQFTTAGQNPVQVTFHPWTNENYTYIQETDASIGQQVQVTGGTWTQVGMVLYDVDGKMLGQAHDSVSAETCYFYQANADFGLTLSPATVYRYRFYAIVDGQTFYSEMQRFTTAGVPSITVDFSPWTNGSFTYLGETDASIGQRVRVNGGIWTEVGMILYDAIGTILGQAHDTPVTEPYYYYRANAELGVTLTPGTVYQYRFYAVVSGKTFYSVLQSFQTEGNAGGCFGVDVSSHQGVIDWDTLAGQIDFAILRCGYGTDLPEQDDERWAYNVSACERLKIPYGVYLFSYAEDTGEAASEAEHVLRLLEGHHPTLPVYYDLEDTKTTGRLTNDQILAQTKVFAAKILDAGYQVGVYSNLSWWMTRLTSPDYDSFDKWMAAYDESFAEAAENYGIWQYTARGGLPGIDTEVDLNWSMTGLPGVDVLPFLDVRTTDWFREDVKFVYENGLMNGTGAGCFSPDRTTSRGMIVAILYRMEGSPELSDACPFADVKRGSYYEKAITWAAQKEIVTGFSAQRFDPDGTITREQLAAILYRYAAYKGYDTTARADLRKYTDRGAIRAYAAESVAWANSVGLITGNTAVTLNPAGSAKRCQAAAILHRFCEAYHAMLRTAG